MATFFLPDIYSTCRWVVVIFCDQAMAHGPGNVVTTAVVVYGNTSA